MLALITNGKWASHIGILTTQTSMGLKGEPKGITTRAQQQYGTKAHCHQIQFPLLFLDFH